MNNWIARWLAMAPRERWLMYSVGLGLVAMLYVLLIADPLSLRRAQQQASLANIEARQQVALGGLAELQARLDADPNLQYRSVLLTAAANRAELLGRIDASTASLISPQQMQALLEELLRKQPQLRLIGLESFSEPVELATAPVPAGEEAASVVPVVLYKHGLRLNLQGGYFDLLAYLQAVQASGWRLNWDSLDYQVGDEGPGKAQIRLKLYTLSRQAGWVGV
jgi:MSHA biogenesis protein MshJ